MPMPGKLKVLLALMALSIASSVIGGAWVSAAISIAIVIGLFIGNETVRKVVLVFSALGFVFAALSMLTFHPLALIAGAVSALQSGFTLVCLTSSDVKTWMFTKKLTG
jgi:hypothetical protein